MASWRCTGPSNTGTDLTGAIAATGFNTGGVDYAFIATEVLRDNVSGP